MTEPKRRTRRSEAAPDNELLNEEAVTGHNSGEEETTAEGQVVAAGELRALIERIERLEEEKKTIADDIKEVYAEGKGTGFDTKTLRTLIRLRRMDAAERQEAEALLDLYKAALGMA